MDARALDRKFDRMLAEHSVQILDQLSACCERAGREPQDFCAVIQHDGANVVPIEIGRIMFEPLGGCVCASLADRAADRSIWVIAVTSGSSLTTSQQSLTTLLKHAAKTDPDWAAAQQPVGAL